MTRTALLVSAVALVAACGGGNGGTAGDPLALRMDALAAMAALDSYAMTVSFKGAEVDDRPEVDYRWETEFVAPDSYRFVLYGPAGETEQRCEESAPPGGSGTGQTCRDVYTEVTGTTVHEIIVLGDRGYARECTDGECEPWQESPRPEVAIAGPSSSYLPGWPLVALELASGLGAAGAQDGLVRLRGSVNHLRAVLENQRRVGEAAGITTFGQECTSATTPVRVGENAAGSPPEGLEQCRDLTFEDMLEQQEPGLTFYDEHPSPIEAWVSPDDQLVRRIDLRVPPEHAGDGELVTVVEYSRFNDVTIEAPR